MNQFNPANNGRGVAPHGGTLVTQLLRGDKKKAALRNAFSVPQIPISAINVTDLEMIAIGAYSPLTGFMEEADYNLVLQEMRLTSGLIWPIPITLSVDDALAAIIKPGDELTLCYNQMPVGCLTVSEKYNYDKKREANLVYGTTDRSHPGVARLYTQGNTLLAGPVTVFQLPEAAHHPKLRHTPAQTRRMFARRGWQRIVGFQTRNPIHRGHEYIHRHILDMADGLFLHVLVGETKADDIPADLRIESYRAMLRDYYPPENVLLGIFPAAMRYAGPREAVFHAICRKNYGCTDFVVGRDHAGVNGFYAPQDAYKLAQAFAAELGMTIHYYPETYYCTKCGGVVTERHCQHTQIRQALSGSMIRQMIRRGELPPQELMRPEVSKLLMEAINNNQTDS